MAGNVINALVMSGGGARGAFEVGAVEHLICDRKIDFQVITGVSTGALSAAMLAQGEGHGQLVKQVARLNQIYQSIGDHTAVFRKRGTAGIVDLPGDLDDLLGGIGTTGIYDPSPLERLIEENVDPERLRNSGRELRIGVVSLQGSRYEAVDQSSELIKRYILASASIPFFFPPVEIDGQQYVDGGARNVTPLSDAFRALRAISVPGNEHNIYVLLASPLDEQVELDWQASNVLDVARRSTDILVSEVYNNDLQLACLINALLQREELPNITALEGKITANIIVIDPHKAYIGPLEFDPQKINAAIEAGRERAIEVLAALDDGQQGWCERFLDGNT